MNIQPWQVGDYRPGELLIAAEWAEQMASRSVL